MNSYPSVNVKPKLPKRLTGLKRLALNLRWSWDADTAALWERMDAARWSGSEHNPIRLLRELTAERLEALAADDDFLAHYDRVLESLDAYLGSTDTWFRQNAGNLGSDEQRSIAYFSAEYGITECLPIYSGGLGVLSGDHLKAASDLGLPLVGVGLFYRQGYFRQRLDDRGNQSDEYVDARPADLPLTELRTPQGERLRVAVPFPGRMVQLRVWRAQVGRVPLLLLDANIRSNRPEDRTLTDRLYGGDSETRIAQELILGVGGYRALLSIGDAPRVFHMNEGHSSFLVLEHLARLVREEGYTFERAREEASGGLVFTTHTPVAAGHDHFHPDLTLGYVGHYADSLGISRSELLGLARRPPEHSETFCMTCLALRSARHANGVSRLHGAVSRAMWRGLWSDREQEDVPIGHITNGVHLETWLGAELKRLFAERFGRTWPRWVSGPDLPVRLGSIGDRTLWRVRSLSRQILCERVQARIEERRAVAAAGTRLDPEALTIGFARRFTAYKRATLVLSDPERFAALSSPDGRPVQLLFAGKAHPRDERGKALLAEVGRLAVEGPLAGRLVLLEGYDLELARYLVQGVDAWLNTPRPPLEASGTSGMKAAANGALNVSTFDGWWAEAWREHNEGPVPIGWVIGPQDAEVEAAETEDRRVEDSAALYDLLEREIVPMFYRRGEDAAPTEWLAMVRASMGQLIPFFNTGRMIRDYTERHYLPALAAGVPRRSG